MCRVDIDNVQFTECYSQVPSGAAFRDRQVYITCSNTCVGLIRHNQVNLVKCKSETLVLVLLSLVRVGLRPHSDTT